MTGLLKALRWRFGSSREAKAKYFAWKYNTFGPGKDVIGSEKVYAIIDCGKIQKKLAIHDYEWLASLASIVAEMEGHKSVAFRVPNAMPTDHETALQIVRAQEDAAIDRIVNYLIPDNIKPTRFVEREIVDEHRVNLFTGAPMRYPVVREIEPDIPTFRAQHKAFFRSQLEMLKYPYVHTPPASSQD